MSERKFLDDMLKAKIADIVQNAVYSLFVSDDLDGLCDIDVEDEFGCSEEVLESLIQSFYNELTEAANELESQWVEISTKCAAVIRTTLERRVKETME